MCGEPVLFCRLLSYFGQPVIGYISTPISVYVAWRIVTPDLRPFGVGSHVETRRMSSRFGQKWIRLGEHTQVIDVG